MRWDIPLLAGSPDDESITDPHIFVDYVARVKGIDREALPDRYLMTFRYTGALDILDELYDLTLIEVHKDYPIYVFEHRGIKMGFRYLDVGAPLSTLILEGTIAWGGRYFVYFGGVGVLRGDIPKWAFIVPDKAIRDEGTSYHYLEPGPYSYPSTMIQRLIRDTLDENGVDYFVGGVWTTDAPYRETKFKRRVFMDMGAICVDMEAAALFAVANYRGVELGCFFYAGDVVGDKWDLRADDSGDSSGADIIRRMLLFSLDVLARL